MVKLTAEVAAAFLSNNNVAIADLPSVVQKLYDSLHGLGDNPQTSAAEDAPLVSVRASVKPDHIACLICGKKTKTLRRHISFAHGLDEASYREKFRLLDTYPMVAPDYSERRAALAKKIGLGTKDNPPRRRAARK